MRIGLVPKRDKPAAVDAALEAARICAAHGSEARVHDRVDVPGVPALPGEELARWAEALVVLGGDGTLIHAAGLCGERELPILGVNLGSLGFLTEFPREELAPALERLLKGDLPIEPRMKLHVRLRRDGATLVDRRVLNDAVISKNALARIADVEVLVDGGQMAMYKADGLIVATPTGSTAYALAAGGPIVFPTLHAVVLAPICPHTLTQRPLVVPDERRIELVLLSDSEMFVTLDGQWGAPMKKGDRLEVYPSRVHALIARNPRYDYFGILRRKLRWGER
jgi:NAD+ kinase